MRDEKMNQGYKINDKKIKRIMKELGLKSSVRIKKYRDSLQRYQITQSMSWKRTVMIMIKR
ncbi:hypothetical protein V8T57_003606 [Bacillus wiedmannii]